MDRMSRSQEFGRQEIWMKLHEMNAYMRKVDPEAQPGLPHPSRAQHGKIANHHNGSILQTPGASIILEFRRSLLDSTMNPTVLFSSIGLLSTIVASGTVNESANSFS